MKLPTSIGAVWLSSCAILVLLAPQRAAAQAAGAASPPRLTLGACGGSELPADARCGTYEVYENRLARSGRKIPLRVVVLPALGPDRAADAVAYFSGGPGTSSLSEGLPLVTRLASLRAHRDFLFVDSRGAGGSAPLTCSELQGVQAIQGFLDEFRPPAKVKQCADRLRHQADLSQYTTDNTVDDVDEVRAALGYEQLDVIADSYGTRPLLVYLRRHPERVRAGILDGVVPTSDRSPLFFARSTQQALDGLLRECARDAACGHAFPHLKREVAAVLKQAQRRPARVRLVDRKTGERYELRLSYPGVAQTLRYMLYDPSFAAELPLQVHLAAQGSWKAMAETASLFARYMISSTSDGYALSITCSEDVPFIRDEEIPAAVSGTFLGDFRIRQQRAACAVWPATKVADSFLAPVVSAVPVLIMAGERDPATPATDGASVARSLANSRYLLINDAGHTRDGMSGQECVDALLTQVIEQGAVSRLDTSCTSRMKRPPFILRPEDLYLAPKASGQRTGPS
jgi:pimeloyl-ACP methyl ester carboxylesterase